MIDEFAETLTSHHRQRLMARAEKQANRWPQTDVPTRRAFFRSLAARVTVGEEDIQLTLGRHELRNTLFGGSLEENSGLDSETQATAADTHDFHIPARLKRCGMEMRLVIPVGGPGDPMPRPDKALIKALIRAHEWKEKLVSGQTPSIHAIANEEGVSERYLMGLGIDLLPQGRRGRMVMWSVSSDPSGGSIRRDQLDHVIVMGEAHLRQLLRAYAGYDNTYRTHLGSNKDTPLGRSVQHRGRITSMSKLGGLHHAYVWV